MTKAITPTSWYYNLYIHSHNETDSSSISRLEIASLLDSVASILVLNLPISMLMTEMFQCLWSQSTWYMQNVDSNQSEIPFKQNISVTCFSSIETKSRYFMIFFTVADLKYKIIGTPSVEKYIQNIKFHGLTMNFNHSLNDQATIVSFTTLIEKVFPSFSLIYQINSKKPLYIKPNTVQILRFPVKTSNAFLPTTDNP